MNNEDFGFVSFNEPHKIPKSEGDFGFVSFNQSPEIKAESKSNFAQETKRHLVRSAARAGETILGMPGDIVGLAQKGIGYGIEKLTGNKLAREAIEKGPQSIKGDEFTPEPIPTSENIREPLAQLTKGYTEPQNYYEEIADDVVSDLTALSIPVKGRIPFMRAIGTAIAANAAKEGAKQLDVGETGQAAIKLGTMFLAGLKAGPKADEIKNNLYKVAKSSIPEGTMIDSTSLLSRIEPVEKELSKGISTATKTDVLSSLKELKNKASGGALPFEDLVQTHHDINEILSSRKLFEELSKPQMKQLRNRYDLLKDVTSKTISEKGKDIPGFLDNWRNANDAHAAIVQSKKVSDTLKKLVNTKKAYLSSPGLIALEILHPHLILPTAGTVAAGLGLMKGGEFISKFYKSPTLRKHYLNLMKNAALEDLPAVEKNIKDLNRDIPRELKEE